MKQEGRWPSEALLDDAADEYDPLADGGFDDEDLLDDFDESGGQQGPLVDAQAPRRRAVDGRSAAERIEDLFAALPARRRVLLGILSHLDGPVRSDALQAKVEELQACDRSVYSGYDYARLLEEAGAVRKTAEDGSPFDEEAEQLPDIVEVDGERFYKPTDGKQVFWVATDEARAYLEADDPFGRLTELACEEPRYASVYRMLLEACDCEEGRPVSDLDELVNGHPLVQRPRRYCSYFTKRLEDRGALVWARRWRTTEVGRRALAEGLFDERPDADAFEGE